MKQTTYQVVSSVLIISIVIMLLLVANDFGWIDIELFDHIRRIFHE